MRLSGITNWRQPRDGDCLPACAAMVLTHLGHRFDYKRLRQQQGTLPTGTPFSHLKRLEAWRFLVERGRGNVDRLLEHLAVGQPVIVAVATELLSYWMTRPDVDEANRATEHVVVVVGMENQIVSVNDPDFDIAPQVVELDWFLAAWQHQQFRYAVIRR
jgi:ABC-type bacteriocin/lantibiotic exporter with double-glycine peptidase domain